MKQIYVFMQPAYKQIVMPLEQRLIKMTGLDRSDCAHDIDE